MNYTEDDHAVWRTLFERQMTLLPGRAATDFLEGGKKLGFGPEAVPDFDDVNRRLAPMTGWQITRVPGIVANDVFFGLLAEKKFPVTGWIRSRDRLDYLEEPDIFHDMFGHVPLLSDPSYTAFLEALGRLAVVRIDDESAVECLARVYWYSIEFGLMAESGGLRIYGSGILSSPGETRFCLTDAAAKLSFDLSVIFRTPYVKDRFQDRYFVIQSLGELYRTAELLPQALSKELQSDYWRKVTV
jgi:phenylalanine-4-hydroxylase